MENESLQQTFLQLLRCALKQEKVMLAEDREDWQLLYQLAKAHSLESLLFYGLQRNETVIYHLFCEAHLREMRRQTIRSFEMQEIFQALQAEEIPFVPLKGWILCELYPLPDMRSMADIDLLCHAENMPMVRSILENRGYETIVAGRGNHYTFYKQPFLHLEFHPQLFDSASPLSRFFSPGWQYVNPESQNQFQKSLSNEGFYLFLLAHLTNHFLHGGSGIRSVLDLWLFREKYKNSLDWHFIKAELQRAGILTFAQNLEHLAEWWFCQRSSPPVIEELGSFIFSCGTYGSGENAALQLFRQQPLNSRTRWAAFAQRVFLNRENMQGQYDFLHRFPFLLPCCWLLRAVRVLRQRRMLLAMWVAHLEAVDTERVEQYRQQMLRFGL